MTDKPQKKNEKGWLADKFKAIDTWWQDSWLRNQFQEAHDYYKRHTSPTRMLQEAAENIFGDSFIFAVLGILIDWMDKDKTTTADDSKTLTSIKDWYNRVSEDLEEAASPPSEPAANKNKQGFIPDNVPLVPKSW